jgi:hypothetical protein
MGVRRVGDIERLAAVARPDVGIVTRVEMAHVEYLGDLDGVARAKSELVAALPASGLAVLNADDPRVRAMASLSACPVLRYGSGAGADVRGEEVRLDRELRPRFRLSSPWGRTEVRLALRGAHQVANALAAATVALWCGVPVEDVGAALAESKGSPWRMEVHHPPGGPVLVVDCFNAMPASAEAAVRSLAALPGERKLALLGVMAELGERSACEHRRIARMAQDLGIEVVGYGTGLYGGASVSGVDDAVALLCALGPGDAALVKGSRVARLEHVVHGYWKAGAAPSPGAGAGAGAVADRSDRIPRGPRLGARCVSGGSRSAQVESLAVMDAQALQGGTLAGVLDAFGDQLGADAVGEQHEAARQGGAGRVDVDVLDQVPVQFDHVRGQVEDVTQRGEPRAGVVDRQADTRPAQPLQRPGQHVVVGDRNVLGQLEHQPLGKAGGEQLGQPRRGDHGRRGVHRQVDVGG